MRPTLRGILALAAGFVVALLPALVDPALWPFWVVYVGVVFLLTGLDGILAPAARRISCDLEAPGTLYIGEKTEVVFTLVFPASTPTPFRAVIDVSELLLRPAPLEGTCPPGGIRLTVALRARRRGEAVIESFWIRYPGPLGLVEKVRKFALNHRISVVPDVLPTRQVALRSLSDPLYRSGFKVERYKGEGSEFDCLRDFVVGDDHRTIHWRASARHRTLLCRQYRAERNHQVIIALDTGYLMSEPLGGDIPKMDHAVSAALLLAYVCLKTGDRVGFYTFDARAGAYLEPRGGMPQHRVLTQATSRVRYSDLETNFTLGLTHLGGKLRRRSLVIVLTDFVDTVTAELMVENLERLARKHVIMFVSLRDPQLVQLAGVRPETVPLLNRAVLAHSYLKERETVLRRLRRQGLFTIDAEPARVGTEMINRYLHVKRRELV